MSHAGRNKTSKGSCLACQQDSGLARGGLAISWLPHGAHYGVAHSPASSLHTTWCSPVCVVPDPIRGGDNVLVMCEVFYPDGTPHETNTRAKLEALIDDKVRAEETMYGFEQVGNIQVVKICGWFSSPMYYTCELLGLLQQVAACLCALSGACTWAAIGACGILLNTGGNPRDHSVIRGHSAAMPGANSLLLRCSFGTCLSDVALEGRQWLSCCP